MGQYIGEIRLFAGNYAPKGWALCNGELLSIQQNIPLYSIIGNLYGGDGITTFALPNFQGMAPMGQGAGPGLTPRPLGDVTGKTSEQLQLAQMPNHTHTANGTSVSSGSTALADPTNAIWGSEFVSAPNKPYAANASVEMNAMALSTVGGNAAHNNMQPFLALNFIIALEGEFPPRT